MHPLPLDADIGLPPVGYPLFYLVRRKELDLHFLPMAENKGVAAIETGGKQQSTGLLHLDGFESHGVYKNMG